MDPTERWRDLVRRPDDAIPLDEGAALIAAHASPGLDVAGVLGRLDELAAGVGSPDVAGVCAHLFATCGFRGDLTTYDDPRNSYLDAVLDRRLGIPISLSVLLIEVARRVGVPLEGVGLPGHYVVRDPGSPDLFIDAFESGRRIDRAECAVLLRRTLGPTATLSPEHLAPATRRATLARMLANLARTFRSSSDGASLAWVTRLQLALPDVSLRDKVALAGSVAEHGRYDQAAELVDELAAEPGLPEGVADRVRAHARGIRSRLN